MSGLFPEHWTAGVVLHGGGDPGPAAVLTLEERDRRCVEYGHPGATFNPWQQRTWCVCGDVIYDGNRVDWGLTKNGGPLDRWAA